MPFQRTEIDFSITRTLPSLVTDYLAHEGSLKPFYSFHPDPDGFKAAIEKRKTSVVDRTLLTTVLKDQYQEMNAPVRANIDSLSDENTFTVTTGHQLNLLTGPLYFIYKILSTIKLSQWLKVKYPQHNFVPLYWMASEDHDIEEINHTFLYSKQVTWATTQKGPAGRLTSEGISEVIELAKSMLGESEQTNKIIELLTNAYSKENSLSKATRILVDFLFSKYGLVILDADDTRLKKSFIPVMQEELISQTSFLKTSETIKALDELKYEAQVTPREINLFYLSDHSRERIVKAEGKYKVLNSSLEWDEKGILKELNENPDRFSPNVVLRPLYQETILPNLAYVGGPSELSYWFEYKSMFDHFNTCFPILVLRNCAMVIDESSVQRMEKLGISRTDLFKSFDLLSKEFISRNQDSFSMTAEATKIQQAYDDLVRKVSGIDSTLAKSVESEKQKQLNGLTVLEEKITRSQKKKHEVSLQQIQKLKERFFPGGTPQERIDNFLPYYAKYGSAFFDMMLESFHPVANEYMVITE
ncbi:bacillithiol biosynthesis cysteine-adding enzyme BshC [soil metagenome]